MKVSIIGAGSYGTALAQLISHNVDTVFLIGRDKAIIDKINKTKVNKNYFPSLKLNDNIRALQLFQDTQCIRESDVIVFSLPSGVTREIAKKLSGHISGKLIISTSKGIEYPSMNTMSQAIAKATRNNNVLCFSGPTFADELIKGFLSGITIGAADSKGKKIITRILNNPNIIYDFSDDIVGIELCGVLKNIYSISIGIFDSFSYSNNEHYAFLTLCFKEMNHIVNNVARDKDLIHKFCCFGDFNLTTNTDKSRNRTLGLMVGKGLLKMNEFKPSIIFEGMKSVKAIKKKSKQLGLNTPIVDFAHAALNKNENAKVSINKLLKDIRKDLN
jgi:glycerol-3-phosphate dehydrogenase (NAD(P)+)